MRWASALTSSRDVLCGVGRPKLDASAHGAMTIRAVGAVCRAAKGLCPARCSQSEKGIAVNSDSSTGENASQQ